MAEIAKPKIKFIVKCLTLWLGLIIYSQICLVNCFHLNPTSKSSTLEDLQFKLDLIIDTEASEKKLLQHLLLENSNQDKAAERSLDSPEVPIAEATSLVTTNKPMTTTTNSPTTAGILDEQEILLPKSVLQKLNENSQRMESMMNLMGDFKQVLSQAVSTQERQLALKNEVIELREEIQYLRQEIQKVKSQNEEVLISSSSASSSLLNHRASNENDKRTIKWLKSTVTELRQEIIDVSSSLNITGLLQLKQQFDQNEHSINRDLTGLQKQIKKVELNSDQHNEELLEVKSNVVDIRLWQEKIGQQLMNLQGKDVKNLDSLQLNGAKEDLMNMDNSEQAQSIDLESDTQVQILDRKLNALKIELENLDSFPLASTSTSTSHRSHRRHHRSSSRNNSKSQNNIKRLQKILIEIVDDQKLLAKRLVKLEQQIVPTTSMPIKILSRSRRHEEEQGEEESWGARYRNKLKKFINIEINQSLLPIEKSIENHTNTFELMDNKLEGLTTLYETTRSIFTSLESLENKYDIKITDLQTSMAKLEVGINTISITTDELKEQQNIQTITNNGIKKDGKKFEDDLESIRLNLASLQNQMLMLELKNCKESNVKSIESISQRSL